VRAVTPCAPMLVCENGAQRIVRPTFWTPACDVGMMRT
jgi:hypothetical protein